VAAKGKHAASLFARSRAMRALVQQARRYAAVDATVLITGETGVGKDALARFIHASGPRRKDPFVTVDCPALPQTLVESELFGHERGAFTDATAARPGRFEVAGHGTLYLDTITGLSPSAQGALLRVVEERRVTRLGATNSTDVRARLIASSNVSLEGAVRTGALRAELFLLENDDAYLAPAGRARPTLEDVERRYIEITLQHATGNQTKAASILGISRKALWEKRKRYGLQ
jgi:DNA-binding NtrC family response regulator